MFKLIFLSSSLLLFFTFVNTQDRCPSYINTRLEQTECFFNQSIEKIYIDSCPQNTKCEIIPGNKSGRCVPFPSTDILPAFPGGKCIINSDCITNDCQRGICNGKNRGENCESTDECSFHLTCLNGFCVYPKPKKEKCEKDSQCKLPYVCFEGECIELFSIDNGVELKDTSNPFVCKSGRIFNHKCNQMKNDDLNCVSNTACSFTDMNGHSEIVEDTCLCEMNVIHNMDEEHNKKKCILGNIDNFRHDKVMEILKRTLMKNNTDYCNLNEKRPGYCRESIRNNWEVRKEQKLLEKYLILSKYGSLIPDENKEDKYSILNVLFSYDNHPPMLRKEFQCPKYQIHQGIVFKENICAISQNPFKEDGSDVSVYINPEKCQEGTICNYNQYELFSQWDYKAKCVPKIKKEQLKSKYLYPGEKCTQDYQCKKSLSKEVGSCLGGKCSGLGVDQKCRSHSDCLIGLYCDGKTHVCAKLKNTNEKCGQTKECMTNHLCMNNTCIQFYSLSNGTYLQPMQTDVFKVLCKYGTMNEQTQQCIDSLEYYKNDINKTSIDGFIRCEHGQLCNYTSGNSSYIYTKKCECGYNVKGYAYCPLSHQVNKELWKEYFELKRKTFMSQCHTENREKCINEDVYDEILLLKSKTETAHLYYKSEEIVKKTLASNYLTTNLKLIFLLVILFIMHN